MPSGASVVWARSRVSRCHRLALGLGLPQFGGGPQAAARRICARVADQSLSRAMVTVTWLYHDGLRLGCQSLFKLGTGPAHGDVAH